MNIKRIQQKSIFYINYCKIFLPCLFYKSCSTEQVRNSSRTFIIYKRNDFFLGTTLQFCFLIFILCSTLNGLSCICLEKYFLNEEARNKCRSIYLNKWIIGLSPIFRDPFFATSSFKFLQPFSSFLVSILRVEPLLKIVVVLILSTMSLKNFSSFKSPSSNSKNIL